MTLHPLANKYEMTNALASSSSIRVETEHAQQLLLVCDRCGALIPDGVWLNSRYQNAIDQHAQWHVFIERAAFIFGSESS